MNRLRYAMFVVTVVLMLVLSAMTTAPVLADDTTPPSSDETSSDETPTEETPETGTVAELIQAAPEGTELLIVDAQGESLPLASVAAAQAVAVVDPVWCPVGVSPKTNGTGGCTTSYGDLKQLVDNLMAGTAGIVPNANGVIWIQAGPDASGGAIELDGTDASLGNMENFSLTLQGRWNGLSGSTVLTGTSTISNSLSILNWQGDITLKDIIVSGVTLGSSLNTAALDISTTRKITLTNVDVASNSGAGTVNGAWLANNDGSVVGDVLITSSTFTDNKNDGLTVYSDGAITITNLVANSNDGNGVYLSNTSAITAKAVTLNGSSTQAKFNGVNGLSITSNGAITLNNIAANNNGGMGVWLQNDTFAGGSAAVNLTGTNTFFQNGSDGLGIYSDGTITVNNIAANNNNGYGAYLDNHLSLTPKAVTISVSAGNPDSDFNNNVSGGLEIHSKGAITVSGVDANNNSGGNGVTLKNDYVGAVGGITINGWGLGASGNNGYGLTASSLGAIINNGGLWAWGSSTSYGALLDNSAGTGVVTIKGDTGYGNNFTDGLTILSRGAVTLSTIYTTGNGGTGVTIDNSTAVTPQNVTLNGANHDFNYNLVNGLLVFSDGMITITNIHAEGNTGDGVVLDNCSQTVPGTCDTVMAKTITLNGTNDFVFNGNNGLVAISKGGITINNPYANGNDGVGAFLNNQMTGSVGTVTLKNTPGYGPGFVNNGLDGLLVYTNGNITIQDIEASNNGQSQDPLLGGYGAYLDNTSGSGNITIGSLNWANDFSNNFLSGLEIYTHGMVTLTNINANGNGLDNTIDPIYGHGAYIDNSGAATPKTVTLNGSNSFYNNYTGGLTILSLGAIKVNNFDASENYGYGALLDNSGATVPAAVTLSKAVYTAFNGGYGLQVLSKGIITVNVDDM